MSETKHNLPPWGFDPTFRMPLATSPKACWPVEALYEEHLEKKAATMTTTSKPRGFAAMDPALRREIAARGGRATVGQLRGFAVSSEKAKEAGRKGGLISRRNALTPPE